MSTQLSKRQQQRNEQVLQGLIKYLRFRHEFLFCREQGNSKCADCGAPNPSWASYNLGISFFRNTTLTFFSKESFYVFAVQSYIAK
jgi:hypothetical protein